MTMAVKGRVMISLSHCLFSSNSEPLFFKSFVFSSEKKREMRRKMGMARGGEVKKGGGGGRGVVD